MTWGRAVVVSSQCPEWHQPAIWAAPPAGRPCGADRSAAGGARPRPRRTRGSCCPVGRVAGAIRSARRTGWCQSRRRPLVPARRCASVRSDLRPRRPPGGGERRAAPRRAPREPPAGDRRLLGRVHRSRTRVPSSTGCSSHVHVSGPRRPTRARRARRSYGRHSMTSSMVESRPTTHWLVVPIPRRPPTVSISTGARPSQVSRRWGSLSHSHAAAGGMASSMVSSTSRSWTPVARRATRAVSQRSPRSMICPVTSPSSS